MGELLDEFEKMKAKAQFNGSGAKDVLYYLLKDIKYYGVIVSKTDVNHDNNQFIVYIKVPGRSELTIEIEKNYCIEASDITLAKYIKDRIISYMNTGHSTLIKVVVKAAIDYNKFWKLEDADKALKDFEEKNGVKNE